MTMPLCSPPVALSPVSSTPMMLESVPCLRPTNRITPFCAPPPAVSVSQSVSDQTGGVLHTLQWAPQTKLLINNSRDRAFITIVLVHSCTADLVKFSNSGVCVKMRDNTVSCCGYEWLRIGKRHSYAFSWHSTSFCIRMNCRQSLRSSIHSIHQPS